jgi:hypothetical protein
MLTIREAVSALALVWLVTLVTACGPSSSRSNSGEPSVSTESNDPGFHLMSAQNKISAAISQSGVTATPPATVTAAAPDCALSASSPDQIPVFKNLQDQLQVIQQDVQAQNTAGLTDDLEAFQEGLMADLDDLLTQIQACIPAAAALPPSASTPPSANQPIPAPAATAGQMGIPNFDFQQLFGQQGMASFSQFSNSFGAIK